MSNSTLKWSHACLNRKACRHAFKHHAYLPAWMDKLKRFQEHAKQPLHLSACGVNTQWVGAATAGQGWVKLVYMESYAHKKSKVPCGGDSVGRIRKRCLLCRTERMNWVQAQETSLSNVLDLKISAELCSLYLSLPPAGGFSLLSVPSLCDLRRSSIQTSFLPKSPPVLIRCCLSLLSYFYLFFLTGASSPCLWQIYCTAGGLK